MLFPPAWTLGRASRERPKNTPKNNSSVGGPGRCKELDASQGLARGHGGACEPFGRCEGWAKVKPGAVEKEDPVSWAVFE